MLAEQFSGLIREIASRISDTQLAKELKVTESELRAWKTGECEFPIERLWQLVRAANEYGFFDVLPAYGMPSVTYDIGSPFNLLSAPIGFEEDPPLVPLIDMPRQIAGYRVDFPLGLPASVLAANSSWIEFYAKRGFSILTYKTVRTRFWKEHPWPNWVFLKNPQQITQTDAIPTVVGYPGFWPQDRTTISMANSFGAPSLAPEWWQEDIRRARRFIREGHQVLIVSVIATAEGLQEIAEDFVDAALKAKAAGADIIEANYSCPNVVGDKPGDLYRYAPHAQFVSKCLREALGDTPLFVKIGYLPEPELTQFVELNAEYIDGIVAINTISGKVVSREDGSKTFPDHGQYKRETAGLSGWIIRAKAQEVARNLVRLREQVRIKSGKYINVLGIGGVLTSEDCYDYLNVGVDAVESCTGAFLNPHLGLETRLDKEALERKPSALAFELEVARKAIAEFLKHPFSPAHIIANRTTGVVIVER